MRGFPGFSLCMEVFRAGQWRLERSKCRQTGLMHACEMMPASEATDGAIGRLLTRH